MNIRLNNKLKSRFIDGLRESNKNREGIHVSDLIYCLREAYYRRVNPKPATETQLMYFLDGARRHAALQSLTKAESEVEVEQYGVTGTIDIKDGVPVEFKSTRAKQALPDHYFRQLGYYCVLSNSTEGILVIQRINNREEPFEVYDVSYSTEELISMRRDLIQKRELLVAAIEKGSPANLLSAEEPWKCKGCQHRIECEQEVT